jgi:hypothetical protein
MFTRASVDCADRIVAISNSNGGAVVQFGIGAGMLGLEPIEDLAVSRAGRGSATRRLSARGRAGRAADVAELFLQRGDQVRQHLEGHDHSRAHGARTTVSVPVTSRSAIESLPQRAEALRRTSACSRTASAKSRRSSRTSAPTSTIVGHDGEVDLFQLGHLGSVERFQCLVQVRVPGAVLCARAGAVLVHAGTGRTWHWREARWALHEARTWHWHKHALAPARTSTAVSVLAHDADDDAWIWTWSAGTTMAASWVGGLQAHALVLAIELLQRRVVAAEQRDDHLAVLSRLPILDDDEVAVADVFVDHRVAAHAQHVGLAPPTRSSGTAIVSLPATASIGTPAAT